MAKIWYRSVLWMIFSLILLLCCQLAYGSSSIKTIPSGKIEKNTTAAIICMIRNEADILPYWITFYSQLVGIRNLAIIDNASNDPKTLAILSHWEKKGLHVIKYTGMFFRKGDVIAETFHRLFPHVHLAIPVDADEFLVPYQNNLPIPDQKLTLAIFQEMISSGQQYLAATSQGSISAGASSAISSVAGNSAVAASNTTSTTLQTCWSIEQNYLSYNFHFNDSIGNITAFKPNIIWEADLSKKIALLDDLYTFQQGFHTVELKSQMAATAAAASKAHSQAAQHQQQLPKNCTSLFNRLGILHYHHRNPWITAQRALNDVVGFGYIDRKKVSLQNVAKFKGQLEKWLKKGKVAAHHKMEELMLFINHGPAGLLSGYPTGQEMVVHLPEGGGLDSVIRKYKKANKAATAGGSEAGHHHGNNQQQHGHQVHPSTVTAIAATTTATVTV